MTATADAARPADAASPRDAARRRNVLAAVGVGAFMSALDTSIVNTILPIVSGDFEVDVAAVEWVITVYLLVQSGLLLSFGRLGDMRGHKSVYLSGYALFVGASALCGFAPSTAFLVVSRAIQAVGASMLIANSPAILTHVFPASQRGRALGLQSTMVYLGLACGPPLGGWLTSLLSWRAVFYINVPVGLAAFLLSLRFVPRDEPGKRERFDVAGAATYVLGLVALLLALNQGHAWGWTSAPVLAAFAVGVVMLAAFSAIELQAHAPMLDLTLFRRRAFTAPVLSAVMNYMGTSSTFFMVPFYLIQGRGLSPGQAGLLMTAQPIVMATTASFSGSLSDRIGSRLPATAGMAVLAVGLFLLSRLGGSTPIGYVAAVLALVGLGVGLFTSPNNSAVMGAVPAARRGVASGVLATARTLGNVLGVGISGAIYATALASTGAQTPPAVVAAVGWAILFAAGIAVLGAFTSATREA
jgi:EmrB/QacA subfamily drug resistance transporter